MGNENTKFTSSKLFIDARDGRIDSVRKGLKATGVDFNVQDEETGRTAISVACLNNMADVVKLLLKKKIMLDVPDKMGLTALHFAAYYGYDDIISQLLAKKANPNLQDCEGSTPLHYASISGFQSIVTQLLHCGADKSIRNKFKLTAEQVSKDEETRAIFSADLTLGALPEDAAVTGQDNESEENEEAAPS